MSIAARERGFTLIELSLALAVMATLTLALARMNALDALNVARNATVATMFEVSEAAKTYYIREVDSGRCTSGDVDCWPADITVLTEGTPPPVFRPSLLADRADLNGWGLAITLSRDPLNPDLLEVSSSAPDPGGALAVAVAFGGLADAFDPFNRERINTTWTAPGTDANHVALLDRAGTREMIGPITFDRTAWLNALAPSIDAGGGDIVNVNELQADIVDADSVDVDTIIAGSLRAAQYVLGN